MREDRRIGRPLTPSEEQDVDRHRPSALAEPNKRQVYRTNYVDVKDENGKVVETRREFVGVKVKPGQYFETGDKAMYQVHGDGSIRRVDKRRLSKGDKRKARLERELATHRTKKLKDVAKELAE